MCPPLSVNISVLDHIDSDVHLPTEELTYSETYAVGVVLRNFLKDPL